MDKKVLLAGVLVSTLTIGGAVLLLNKGNAFSVAKADNEPHVLSLHSSTISNLTSEYSNNTFEVNTVEGNKIQFEYRYGKASSGNLIEIGNAKIGNPTGNDYYVGNTSPITGVETITVAFSGADYLALYASIDGVSYDKVEVFTSSKLSTTMGKGYFYYRFVNASQTKQALTISSINMPYTCVGYNDEVVDLTNVEVQPGNSGTKENAVVDTVTYLDHFNSSQSLKLTGVADQSNFVFPLGKTFSGVEMKNMIVEFYVDATNNTSPATEKSYFRFNIYATKSWSKTSGSYQTTNINHGTTWTQIIAPLSNIGIVDENEYDGIYLRASYISDINIDHLRIYYSSSYPEIPSDLYDTYEANDLSNGTFVSSYNSSDLGVDYGEASENSLCSRKIKFGTSQDNGRFNINDLFINMTGKVISVDVKLGEGALSNTYLHMHLMGADNSRYDVSLRVSDGNAGVTSTQLTGVHSEWTRYVIDFDTAIVGLTPTTKTSAGDYGFYAAHISNSIIYFDNLTITNA